MIAILIEMTQSMLHAANIDLQYWGKVFMYTYICSIMPSSALNRKILFTEWSNSHEKPDVSHLCIFRSFEWMHILKEIRHRKLKSYAVRVCMLGWCASKTKKYKLENLKNGKLISSHDMQFHKDDVLSKLVQVKYNLTKTESKVTSDFIEIAKYSESDMPQQVHLSVQPSDLSQLTKSNNYVNAPKGNISDNRPQPMIVSHPVTPEQDLSDIEISDALRKRMRWKNLPKYQLFT